MFKSFKWALLLVLLTANILSAATYYVSKTGSDSGAGTQSAPWLTVVKAATTAQAGDTVNIAAGTYSGSVTFNNSGSVASPITIIGSGGVVIAANITLSGNYVTLSGITCSPPSAGNYNAIGLSGQYDVLTNCTVVNYGATASDQAAAIEVSGAYNRVISCTVRDLNDIDAFHIWGHDNTLLGCTVTNLNEVNYALNHTDFVQTWGSSTYNVLIKNCQVLNSTCQLGNTEMDFTGGTFGWTFENCVFRNIANCYFSGMPNTHFYNCVFDNVGVNQGAPILWYASTVSGSQRDSSGSSVENCVFYNCSPMGGNGYPVSSITQVANYSGSSPGFVNEASGNYHLAAGSPLIGAGVNLSSIFTIDLDGNSWPLIGAWDIGAYRYTSGGASTNAPAAAIQVTPGSVAFGTILNGSTKTGSFTVKNMGGGTLSGTASVGSPFSIVSGGSYNLSSNQSQTVTVSFNPTTAGSYSQSVTLTGGGGASVSLTASATNAPLIIPTVSAISVNVTDVDLTLAGLQIYPGTTVQFSATATNAQTWQWSYSVNGGSPVIYSSGTGPVTNVSYYFDTNAVGNSYDWTLVVSNGQAGAESSTNLAVEALPNLGAVITNIIQGPIIAATSGILSSLLTASTTINGVPTSYFYQPLPSIGNTSGGTATYNVTITNAGNYEIQALVYAPNLNANSFLVNIDGQPQNPTMIWDIMPVTSGFEQRLVSWRGTTGSENNDSIVPKVFTLGAGPHQIVFVGREPGTAMASFTLQQVVTTIQSPPPPTAPSGLRIISSAP